MPPQLISYVFANPDDEYRGNDLLTLNLKQYLWQLLHRSYNTVYFLSSPDGRRLTVQTFGDQDAKPYTPPIIGSHVNRFSDWLLKQMELPAQSRAAFVCDLGLFCRIFSQSDWEPLLEDLAASPKRSGSFVLTASPYAEDSQKYLLERNSVFDRLREIAVTDSRGGKRCVYKDLQEKKPDHYLCLNAFTPERIDALLLHICVKNPRLCLPAGERMDLATNLAAHLQQELPLPDMHRISKSLRYLTYKDLYEYLSHPEVWAQLLELSPRLRPAQSLPILRSPHCYAGKCLALQLPAWAQNRADSGNRYPEDTLDEICKIVSLPLNHPEHPQLLEGAQYFLDELNNLIDDDIDTCSLLLDGLKFCAEQMNTWKEENVPDILDTLEQYQGFVDESIHLFELDQTLDALVYDPFAPGIGDLRNEQKNARSMLNDCLGYLRLSKLKLLKSASYIDLRQKYYEQYRKFDSLVNGM